MRGRPWRQHQEAISLTSRDAVSSLPTPSPSHPLRTPRPLCPTQDTQYQERAISAWEAAAGGRYKGKVIPVGPADHLIKYHGSVHCITRTVPRGMLPNGWLQEQLALQQERWRERGWA